MFRIRITADGNSIQLCSKGRVAPLQSCIGSVTAWNKQSERQKNRSVYYRHLTDLKVSAILLSLSDLYAGYENGMVIYVCDLQRREQAANAARYEAIRLRCKAACQATQEMPPSKGARSLG